MITNLGYVLTDDIVVNYKSKDRDDNLHFLTHIDSGCKDLKDYISPTAKRIYTSNYNAWFLKQNFDVKHIDLQGFNTNTSYKVTFKGSKYIYSFIDSKFTTGSVALLLHGSFGTYLYTGNFSYYSAFVKSPVLLPVIQEKALTRLYLDNTYYEQPIHFFGFDELANRIAKIIRSEPKKYIYLYADRVNTCPLIAEIASKLEEKVYICYNTKQIMTILGYGSYFTCDASQSRILVGKAYIKKRGHDENISIQITRHEKTNENPTIFTKNERKGNSYNFYYYCHSTHKEICELLSMLKPESMTCLFSDLDKSKVNYNLDFKPDTIQTRLFKSFLDKSTRKLLCVEEAIKNNEETGGSTIHENEDSNVNSMFDANKSLIRVLRVPEINSSVDVPYSNENSISMTSNASLNEEITNTDSIANPLTSQNLHNYCRSKKTNNSIVEYVKLSKSPGNGFNQTNTISGKPPNVRKTQIAVPLVIDRKLVKENTVAISNNKLIKLPKMITNEKKKSILLPSKYINFKNSHSVELSPNYNSTTCGDSGSIESKKKQLGFHIKSKVVEFPSVKKSYKALHQPHSTALNMSSLYCGWMGNNSIPGLSSSSQTLEGVNNSEGSPTDRISQNQEVFERTADQPGGAIVSANQHLQENNKIIEIDEVVLNDTDLSHSQNNNGSMSDIQTNLSMDKDSCGTLERQSTSVDCISDISNSPSKAVRPADTSSSTDVTITHMQSVDIDNSMVSNSSNFTDVESINNDNNKIENLDGKKKKSSKRAISVSVSDGESLSSRKKLRSDDLRMLCSDSNNSKQDIGPNLKLCYVLLKRNAVERSYFFSRYHKCHMKKFCGFKKHEVRPRQHLLNLQNLRKRIEQLGSK